MANASPTALRSAAGRRRAQSSLICDQLPYAHHMTSAILVLDSQALMMSFALDGAGFETADAQTLQTRLTQLNDAWRNLADERLAVWHHVVRRSASPPPCGVTRSRFAGELDRAYRDQLNKLQLFETQLYLSLVLKPRSGDFGLFGRLAPDEAEVSADQSRLETAERELCELLERYRPRRLELREDQGLLWSEPLELIAQLLAGEAAPVPLVRGRAAGGLPGVRLIFGRESLEVRHAAHSTYGAMFSLKEYPAQTFPGMWDGLLDLPFPLTITQSFAFLSKPAALAVLSRKQNQMVSARDPAASQVADLGEAMDDLTSNRMAMGEHHASVLVWALTPAELSERMAKTRAVLAESGLVSARDDLGLAASYWAQFPGVFGQRLRPAPITSLNFAAFAPFHAHPRGRAGGGHWGASLTTLRTSGASAYHFHLHVADVGHTFICGPTGSGKTVVQNFLLAQLEKAGAQAVLVDKDRGGETFVRACEGAYLTFTPGVPTGLAPLRGLDLTAENQAFLAAFFARLLQEDETRPLSASDQRRLARAVAALAPLPREQRAFSTLQSLLGQSEVDGLSARLQPWCAGERWGWAFDNAEDQLSLEPTLIGLDVTHFLDDARLRPPLMMYLLHRIGARVDGRRLVVDIDEFWKALGDEAFRGFAQDGLKTFRKQNAALILATQSPADVLKSPIAHALLEQCVTKIYLPNPQGNARDYVEGFGLTEREFELVRTELSPARRQFLIKQGLESVVAELRLDGLAFELAVLSGRAESLAKLDALRRTAGASPEHWLTPFRTWSESS